MRRILYTTYYTKIPERGYFQTNEIMLRNLKMYAQLGYSSYAVCRLERRLAKSSRWGYRFIDMLEYTGTLFSQAVREVKSLLAIAGLGKVV